MATNILKFKGDLTPSALSVLEKNSEIFLDCEATGLKINRDRLSLVTIFNGHEDCFIVQPSKEYQCPNLVSLLTNKLLALAGILTPPPYFGGPSNQLFFNLNIRLKLPFL